MTDEWAGKIAVVIIKRKQIAGAMLNIIRILKRVVQENREPMKIMLSVKMDQKSF